MILKKSLSDFKHVSGCFACQQHSFRKIEQYGQTTMNKTQKLFSALQTLKKKKDLMVIYQEIAEKDAVI